MFVTCCIKGVKKIQLCTPSFWLQRVGKRISFLGKVKKRLFERRSFSGFDWCRRCRWFFWSAISWGSMSSKTMTSESYFKYIRWITWCLSSELVTVITSSRPRSRITLRLPSFVNRFSSIFALYAALNPFLASQLTKGKAPVGRSSKSAPWLVAAGVFECQRFSVLIQEKVLKAGGPYRGVVLYTFFVRSTTKFVEAANMDRPQKGGGRGL